MGYSTLAFNHVLQNRMDPTLHRNPFYMPLSATPGPSFAPSSSSSPYTPPISSPAFPELASIGRGSSAIEQLNRFTLVLDATADSAKGGGAGIHPFWPALVTYDLLAVQPLTSNQFNAACLTYTELKPGGQSFDIISLDLSSSPRLPFYLKRTTVGKALENGAVFEVCYGEVTTSSSSRKEDRIRNLISNTRDLLRVTSGGRGVILSSGAASVLGLRSPLDVANLAAMFGFHPQRAREALSQTSRQVVQRAHARRTFKGITALPLVVTTSAPAQAVNVQLPIKRANSPDPQRDFAGLVSPAQKGRTMLGGTEAAQPSIKKRKEVEAAEDETDNDGKSKTTSDGKGSAASSVALPFPSSVELQRMTASSASHTLAGRKNNKKQRKA